MTRSDMLSLLAYMDWSRERMFAALTPVSPEEYQRSLGGSFETLHATLVHMYGAERVWLARLRGERGVGRPEAAAVAAPQDLMAAWRETGRGLHAWLAGQPDGELPVLAYTSLDGTAYRGAAADLLQHVANHQTFHRGQVMHMLRQLGHPAPATDLVMFQREQGAAQAGR